MSSVLGWPLEEAVACLRGEGFSVVTREVSSKKGTDGNDARVIAQKAADDGQVVLSYAFFKTELEF